MRNTSPRSASPVSRRVIWLIAGLLLASTLLAACGAPTANQQTSLFAAATVAPTTTALATGTATAILTPTAAPPTNIATPTVAPIPKSSLPTLAPEAGWRTVLTLSDTTGAHGGDIQQQNFIATRPYVILYSCKGDGAALKVIYQDTVSGAYCANPPRINRTKTLTSTQPDHSAFVTVSPMGNIIWELLVEMQD